MKFIRQDEFGDLWGIYQIRNLVTGRVYIGQTGERFLRRYWHHRWKLMHGEHDNPYLQKAFQRYGTDSFVFEVLAVLDDKDLLDSEEIRYIDLAEKKYNICRGGGGLRGYRMKEETKALIGDANRKHMLGKKHTEETKQKMSQSRTGKPYTKYRSTTVFTPELVRKAKKMLISGATINGVSETLDISYHAVNALVSLNTWNDIHVDGWDEFLDSRKKSYRLTRDDADTIRLRYQNGATIEEICAKYHKTPSTIRNIISFRTFK